MSEALKPCPFCGSKAEPYPDGDMEGFGIMCTGEHALFGGKRSACPIASFAYASHEEAVAAWNTRATPSPDKQAAGGEGREDFEVMANRHIADLFVTGENMLRDQGYLYRSLGTPSNVWGRDLMEFAWRVARDSALSSSQGGGQASPSDEQIEQAARADIGEGLKWTGDEGAHNRFATAPQRAAFRRGAKWGLGAQQGGEDARDAARYRWLKEYANVIEWRNPVRPHVRKTLDNDVDEAIRLASGASTKEGA